MVSTVLEVVIIIVRGLIRICVAQIVIISTCLCIVMLINSRVEVVAVRARMIVITAPRISLFGGLATVRCLIIVLKVFVLVIALGVRVRLRDFPCTFSYN